MNEAQSKAWNCLREDEQQSLFLQISNGKSAWEAGTIMKRSHYKYIEIRERSQKFFKMFADFFEEHDSIFRPDAPYRRVFIDYIEACIEKRLSRREAAMYSGDSTQMVAKVRTSMLENNLRKLRDSEDSWDKDTFTLIIEFDRWNNFRILPRMWQAPSAYKRRSNEKQKIYINYLRRKFPEWAHKKLIERFRSGKAFKDPSTRGWVCLVSRKLYPKTGYYVFPVKYTKEAITEMSRFFLYIFPTKDDADSFGFMIDQYMDKTRTIPSGQNFWEEFRAVLELAVNYKEINYIDFNMKTLDMAYTKHLRPGKKKKKDKELEGQKRANENLFYK